MKKTGVREDKCTGCGACESICPVDAISMKVNKYGFRIPVVDECKCIDCQRCQKVCPIEKKQEKSNKCLPSFYAAYHRDKNVALNSSSGGVFWSLCEWMIGQKGVVYGAISENGIDVKHARSETLEGCKMFQKSKYVQSDTNLIYRAVHTDLKAGRKVLFSGTPCQVAGLYGFLDGNMQENVFTCDVVCHGVPSGRILDLYLADIEERCGKKVESICWRNKDKGWNPNYVSLKFEDGDKKSTLSHSNSFQWGFLCDLYHRPSCYTCSFAKLPRVGDISLADFWGYEGKLLAENENAGISIVIASSEKGRRMVEYIASSIVLEETTERYVKERSRHSYRHPKMNRTNILVYKNIDKLTFAEIEKKYIFPSFSRRMWNRIFSRVYLPFFSYEMGVTEEDMNEIEKKTV